MAREWYYEATDDGENDDRERCQFCGSMNLVEPDEDVETHKGAIYAVHCLQCLHTYIYWGGKLED